ncbi:MAG: transposase [Chitinophagales bacterium]|nr:transposase [Chitinophagales bacterium]OJV26760.1 MAG: transposase [Bacteroidetes bacterium 37-13]HRP40062.1 transposase [Chitinophagales bacterium]
MAFAYTVKDQFGLYFVTFTVHQWADVFTRRDYSDIIIDSLKFCQKEKGLNIYAYVIMSNHIHLIIQSRQTPLSDIIRDLKKFTATKIVNAIRENPRESRRKWLLWLFKKEEKVWFWEEGYHGEEIFSKAFFDTKLKYIHQNPVRAGIVEKEEEYLLSSCCDYYGNRKGLLELAEY